MMEPYKKHQLIAGLSLLPKPISQTGHEQRSVSGAGEKILKGQRHEAMKTVAAHLRNARLSGERLWKALSEENQARCTPPLPEEELRKIAQWFAGKETLPEAKQKGSDKRLISPPPIVSFSELMEMDLPEPRWIIEGMLPEGLCVLAGAPKIGKSWLAQDMSLSIAAGAPFLSRFKCEQGAVLHLALEDNPRRFRKRMAMMLRGNMAPRLGMFSSSWPPFSDGGNEPDGLGLIHKWLEEYRETARAVVIDTFARIRPRKPRHKEDIYTRDYHDLEGLQQLGGQYSVAIVVVHHQNKGEHKDPFNTISGSTGITGAADSVWILEKMYRTDADGTLFISGRDIEEQKGALRFERGTGLWRWLGDEAELRMSKERLGIRDILRSTGKPMKPAEIAELIEPKKSPAAIQRLLTKMLATGEAIKTDYGQYSLPLEDSHYSGPGTRESLGGSYHEEEIDLDQL